MTRMETEFLHTAHSEPAAERWSSRVLKLGVWISAILMAAGLFEDAIDPSSVANSSATPSLSELGSRIFSRSFDPSTLLFTGLVFLMCTPILRVITAIAGFSKERDWRFVLVSSIVLLLLGGEIVYSLFIRG